MRRCWWLGLALCAAACGDDPATPSLPTIAEIPPIADMNPDAEILEVELVAAPAQVELVAGQLTNVYAYNGRIPAPLFHIRAGDRIIVHFTNDLPEETTIHWHGLRIPDSMDGTPMVQAPIQPGASFTYDFVVPDAGTFWFHPHLNTIEQIDRGLYGAIVAAEREAPTFTAERVFVLDDVRLDASYQHEPYVPQDLTFGRQGSLLLINGKAATIDTVAHTATAPNGAIERWRFINSSGSSTYQIGINGATWRVIGVDGGLLPTPWSPQQLFITVGQRFDLEVTYDSTSPSTDLMVYWGNTITGARFTREGSVDATPPSYPTVTLPEIPATPLERDLILSANGTNFTINGMVGDHEGMHPIEQFQKGVPVRFRIENAIVPFHPFHLHGQFFQILTRNGETTDEPGLRDMVLLNAGEEVTVLTWLENPGRWMYHCHIPEHAELGMMAELQVIEGAPSGAHSH